MKAITTKFSDPYNGNSTSITHLRHDKPQSGVYFIKSKRTDEIVYIGFSKGNLYKTIYRHFQRWVDTSREVKTRFTYNKTGYQVRVIFTTPHRAEYLEKYLILKMKPRDNKLKYDSYLNFEQKEIAETTLKDTEYFSGSEKDFPF